MELFVGLGGVASVASPGLAFVVSSHSAVIPKPWLVKWFDNVGMARYKLFLERENGAGEATYLLIHVTCEDVVLGGLP